MSPSRKAKYPGRDRVIARDDARALRWRDTIGDTLAPWCSSPHELNAIGLPGLIDRFAGDDRPVPVTIRVACRKCEGCLIHRRNLWAARATDEIRVSTRSWFVTLTVAPQHRFRLGLTAEKQYLRPGGETLADLSPDELFRYQCKVLNRELTLMLKRVRKKARFRFIAVFERHRDGFPHLHLLIHERGQSITKSAIQAEWRLGFSQCKLVDDRPGAAFYVAKYLAKEAATRVRASVRYGQSAALLTEHLNDMCDAVSRARAANGDPPPSKGSERVIGEKDGEAKQG